MFKGYWLHLKSHPKKCYKTSKLSLVILLCLLLFYVLAFSLEASSVISIEKIKQLERKSQGQMQKRYRAWWQLIESLKNKPVSIQLAKVNAFFNQFNYQSDMASRGVADYWSSPEEFIEDGGGDCEDFAIIKYFTLITLGVPEDSLRMTYVTSPSLKEPHMVLSYYSSPEVEPLILDSLEYNILKASQRPDLKPVYSFNASGLWLAKQRDQNLLKEQPNHLSKWDELIKRMQQQGDKP